ncbi:hypothetical protein SRABI04_01517 [Chryseobacterium sp. Bi04]|nr:hypothetical protein SRABI04_01517 [Chryseobacterium sp. Bi04]
MQIIQKIIFSFITRIFLCLVLFFSEPVSLQFRFLCVIIFCIPWIRFFMNDTDRKNIDQSIYYKLLFLTTPVLYIFIAWKIFELYHFSLITQLVLFSLPVIAGLYIKSKDKDMSKNSQSILQTMSFYSILFFLALNVSFDFSKPLSKVYLITDKAISTEEKTDSDGYSEITNYQFMTIPKEKMNPVPFWKDVSATEHTDIYPTTDHHNPTKTFLIIQNMKYEILDKKFKIIRDKNSDGYLRSYYLKEYTKPDVINVRRKTYNQFGKGDYLDIETYPGLFGIGWTYYHWKHNHYYQ